MMTIWQKYDSLREILKRLGRVLVAYSGGVDSTFLLKVAVDTLGSENVSACIAAGPSQPRSQLPQAEKMAKLIGVKLIIAKPKELAVKRFIANKPDRCFHCKVNICKKLLKLAGRKKLGVVIFGTNADDKHVYRPGHKALEMFDIANPLAEADLTKKEIRELSKKLKLPTYDMPANPCLVTRLEYGLKVTPKRLKQVDEAEDFLKQFGLREFRLRHHGDIARIEVRPNDFDKITKEKSRAKIITKIKSLGFKFVTLDLEGYRSGSFDNHLKKIN